MKKDREHVSIGEIELTKEYFNLSDVEKEKVCLGLIELMVTMFEGNLPKYINTFDMVDKVLLSSLITNTKEENYEICEVLRNCQKIINEKRG